MGKSAGTNAALIMGLLFLIWSSFVLAASLSYVVNPSSAGDNQAGANSVLYFCTPLSFLLTFIFFGIWYIRNKKESQIEDMASYLKMYRRIQLDKVAQRMNISLRDAENLLPECISQGLVKGYLDRFTGEFIWEGSMNQMRVESKCQNCGGSLDRVIMEGEIMKCSYCDAVIPPRNMGQSNQY